MRLGGVSTTCRENGSNHGLNWSTMAELVKPWDELVNHGPNWSKTWTEMVKSWAELVKLWTELVKP